MKTIPWKFCILKPKNSGVVHQERLYFPSKFGYFLTYSISERLYAKSLQTSPVNN